MYTGTMIEDLIATVERAECWALAEPAEILQEEDMRVAYLLKQSNGGQLVEMA